MEQEKGAVYCRLSQDDGSAGESGSIQTQRTLLTQYCKEHSIQIIDYYCDDGWRVTIIIRLQGHPRPLQSNFFYAVRR